MGQIVRRVLKKSVFISIALLGGMWMFYSITPPQNLEKLQAISQTRK